LANFTNLFMQLLTMGQIPLAQNPFSLFILFLLIIPLSSSSSSKKEWPNTRDCIFEGYAQTEIGQQECAQLWDHYDPVELNGDWIVLEKMYNQRKDRTMEWKVGGIIVCVNEFH